MRESTFLYFDYTFCIKLITQQKGKKWIKLCVKYLLKQIINQKSDFYLINAFSLWMNE